MPKLTTDFNVSPYYDDFSEDKKILQDSVQTRLFCTGKRNVSNADTPTESN